MHVVILQTDYNGRCKPRIVDEDGDYSIVNMQKISPEKEIISCHCEKIRESVYKLIDTYSHTFNVDFELSSPTYEFTGDIKRKF